MPILPQLFAGVKQSGEESGEQIGELPTLLRGPEYSSVLFLALEGILALLPAIHNIRRPPDRDPPGAKQVFASLTVGTFVQAKYVAVI